MKKTNSIFYSVLYIMLARLGLGRKPMPTITVEPNEGNNCGEDSFDSNIHRCIILRKDLDLNTNNLDRTLQFVFDSQTQKYIVFFLNGTDNGTDKYTIVRCILYEGGIYRTDFDELTKESDNFQVREGIYNFNFFKKSLNIKDSNTHIKLITREPDSRERDLISREVELIKNKQRVICMAHIEKLYGMSLMEVNFTSYTQLGINFLVFSIIISDSDHFYVCITYNSAVTNSSRVASTKYGIEEYSILKCIRYNNEIDIYLNDYDEEACNNKASEFVKKLKALSEDDSNSITIVLIKPKDEALYKLQLNKHEAIAKAQAKAEAEAQAKAEAEAQAKAEAEAQAKAKAEAEASGTGMSPEALAYTTGGGRVRVRPFITSLTKRRKSIKRRKPRKKRRVTKKNKKKLN
jgi:hypothetical protein